MKILQLHNTQLSRGGADIELEREAAGLRGRGHQVETMLVDNREIEQIGSARAALKAIWNQAAFAEAGRRIEDFEPDVVHVHTPFPLMSPSVFVAASRRGVPVVATAHSFRYSCVKAILQRDGELCHECVGKVLKLPAIRHRCYKDSLPGSVAMASSLAIHRSAGTFSHRVDRFIALTPFMRDLFIAEGIPEERVTVIFNAAPDPGPPRNETRGYAAFVGRFVAEKGVRTILRAWELLDAEIPIILAGDGPLRPEIEAAAALDHRITVLPWLSSTEVTELLARADISIVASEWYEGLGLVIPESFAVGTPVLASDVGNFCDLVIPGHSGDHFRSGDATDLARAIGQFFEVADRTSFRTNVRREYDSMFSPQLQLDRLEALYDTVIAEHASGR